MYSKYLLLFLLPALVHARIDIKINADKNPARTTIDFSGKDIAIITDEERQAFQLDDESLKAASKIFAGARCTDVFLRRPTPWEDVYRKFGWPEIQRTLKPIAARVIGVNAKPEAVATAEYENHHSTVTAKYNTAVSQAVEESVSHRWRKGGEFTVEQEINYSINVGAAGSMGGSTTFSYTSSWGNDTTKEKKVTLGTTSTVEVQIPPGGGVLATLQATRGTMEIEIDYEGSVTGDVFCNYHNGYRNHHWWAYPVRYLQQYGNLPTTVKSTERITIGFYTSARIVVKNLKNSTPIKNVPAGIISELDDFNFRQT